MTTRLALLLCVFSFMSVNVFGQEVSAAQNLENLRAQMGDLLNRETDLKNRLDQIEIEIRPENIERSLAGVGSTRPEELREQRRQQLQAEKDRVTNELQQLDSRRSQLSSAISEAEAKAYQQSALGQAVLQRDRNEPSHFFTAARLAIGISTIVVILAAIALLLIVRKRQQGVQ